MDKHQLLFLILLATSTTILYLLPFIPAWIEWRTRADSEPFHVNFQDRTVVDYCIRIFRDYIFIHFESLLEEYSHLNTSQKGIHVTGEAYYITGGIGAVVLPAKDIRCKKTNKIILICQSGVLPDDMTFENKVYAKKSLTIGVNSSLYEVIADGDIQVGSSTLVKKLIVSGASITVDNRCILNGYTRAQNKIHFLSDAKFKYLCAPNILFGHVSVTPPKKAVDIFSEPITRLFSEDKLVIPEHTELINHIVAKNALIIKNDCMIRGNIKCHQTIFIEKNTTVIGALFSEKDIFISSGCFIQGPIVARGMIKIAENSMIGAQEDMTSLVAQTVQISNGCRVSGLVLAKLKGSFK